MAIKPSTEFPGKIDTTDPTNYPQGKAQNIILTGDGKGTPWVAKLINDIFGFQQRILALAGLSPDNNNETVVASQYMDGLRMAAGYPGIITMVGFSAVPSGLRMLLLQGGTILHASYPELTTAVYVGDGNNSAYHAAGGAFCKTTDAAGTIPNTAGTYLTMPDMRGSVARGLDLAGSIDPAGAARHLGDYQNDNLQVHNHIIEEASGTDDYYKERTTMEGDTGNDPGIVRAGLDSDASIVASHSQVGDKITAGGSVPVIGVGRMNSVETRVRNIALNYAIWY